MGALPNAVSRMASLYSRMPASIKASIVSDTKLRYGPVPRFSRTSPTTKQANRSRFSRLTAPTITSR
ncbi:hypothetical protein D3C81_2235440 [compost metagenome]